MANLACSSSRPLGTLEGFLLKNKTNLKTINTRAKRQTTLHNMECDITDKSQTLILTIAQKQKKKGGKYPLVCYLNNAETSMPNLQGCHIITFQHLILTFSSTNKKKRAENLAKVKTNTYHIKGISAKLLILKGKLIVSPGNIQKDLLSLQKQYLFFKRCTSNQANTSLPGSWSSSHLKKKPKEETKQNNQGSIFLVAEKEQPLTETELPDTWCYLRNWSGTWACITS